MKKLLATALLASTLCLGACTYQYTPVLHGTDLQKVDLGSGRIRKGTACGQRILFFGPFEDYGVVRAAQNGRIRRILITEERIRDFVLFSEFCTTVYGE